MHSGIVVPRSKGDSRGNPASWCRQLSNAPRRACVLDRGRAAVDLENDLCRVTILVVAATRCVICVLLLVFAVLVF